MSQRRADYITSTQPIARAVPVPDADNQWHITIARVEEMRRTGVERVVIEFSRVEWVITPLDDTHSVGIKP